MRAGRQGGRVEGGSALTFMIAGTVKEVVTGAGRQADWEGGGWEGTQGAGGRREPRYFY